MYPLEAVTSIFDASILEAIASHADREPLQEVCGLIVQDGDTITAVEFENVSPDPKNIFAYDKAAYKKVVLSGVEILASYHSHWSDEQLAVLGFDDVCWSKKTRIPYLLFHAIDRTFDYFDPADLNPFPLQQRNGSPQSVDYYLGWMWMWGRSDCYTLMRHYYRGMLGIDLADYERSHSPMRQHLHPYKSFDEGMPEIGFKQLPSGATLQDHDVVLMAIKGDVSHHCAVIVDAAQKHMIHLYNDERLSEKTIYGDSWADNTRSIWRHEEVK